MNLTIRSALAAVAAVCFSVPAAAEQQEEGVVESAVDAVTDAVFGDETAAEKMAEAWTEYGTPGAPHEQMARLEGEWDVVAKSWMPGVSEPEISEGEAEYEMLYGGRYLRQSYEGEFAGEEFVGEGTLAFDNAKKVYRGTWIDNMSTGLMVTTGTYDRTTNTLVETGESIGPFGPSTTRIVTEYLGPDEFVMTIYCDQTGEMTKGMEFIYTRAD